MTKLYIARHGETDYNVQNRYAGTLDIELNNKGREQSEKLADKLADKSIDLIISSSKKRALQTAEIINDKLKKPLILSELLIERDLGIFEGLTRAQVKQMHPMLWQSRALHKMNSVSHKGESVAQVIERAKAALDEVLSQYSDKNVLLVTHGYISRMMNGILKNLSYTEMNQFLLTNCQVKEYDIN